MKDSVLLKYFGVLLLVLTTWTNVDVLPPMIFRLIYTFFIIYPLLKYRLSWFPPIFLMFVTISMNRYAPSYMPATPALLTILFLFVYLVTRKAYLQHIEIPKFLFIFLIWIFLVDLFYSLDVNLSVFTLTNAILLFRYLVLGKKTKELFLYSFIVTSLLLSIEFLMFGANFSEVYSTAEIERMGWKDPNVFGCIIGMGVFASIIKVLESKRLLSISNTLYYITIVISLIACLKNASRGAALALAVAIPILLFFSKVNKKTKFVTILGMVFLVIALYYLNFFSTLEARMALENAETGGERTIIWATRLKLFFSDTNFFHWIFGLGVEGGCNLGYSYYLGFHSDYVAILVEYGFVGFILFLYMLYYPIKRSKTSRYQVIAGVTYLAVCCFSLDLIGTGNITFFAFYLFLIVLGRC